VKNSKVKALLEEYQFVFAESKHLPPTRKLDYKIPLSLGAKLVNIKPYKSELIQKEKIEKLKKDMLQNGIIHHSCSPFASFVFLVKSKIIHEDYVWITHN
jgi:hypothetical protein